MSTLNEIIKQGNCDELHCTIDNGTARYLCFTRLDDMGNFTVCASDGVDLWSAKFDEDELDAHRDFSNMNIDAYLAKLK